MSASKEKKVRVEQRGAGTDKKRNAASEEAARDRKFRRNAIIAVVCIVLVVAAALFINSNFFYTSLTALTIGNTSYSAAEVDVFYRTTYNTLYNTVQSQYGDLASYMLPDSNTALNQQQYSETQTWADYLLERTIENMKQVTALYEQATANGYVLTEEDRSNIDAQMASMEQAAAQNNITVAQFLSAVYGKGVSTQTVESVVTKLIVSDSYSDQVQDGLQYTDADLDAYYAAHKDELDYVRYWSYFVSSSNDAFAEEADDAAKQAAAHAAAQTIADAATDGERFAEAVHAFYADAYTAEQNYQGQNLPDSYSAWLLDAARKTGDVTVTDTDGGSYVLLFVDRDDNDYHTRAMRHILINVETDDEGNVTDPAKDAAEVRIREIADEWEAEPTAEHFAELANTYSDDPGSNTNGGLYENIYRGQMVPPIDSFLFTEGAQPGDTTVVYADSSYYGWHLVYYVGEDDGPLYKYTLAEDEKRSADYDAWLTGLTDACAVTTGSGRNYVKLG